jgi:hypothetical protein
VQSKQRPNSLRFEREDAADNPDPTLYADYRHRDRRGKLRISSSGGRMEFTQGDHFEYTDDNNTKNVIRLPFVQVDYKFSLCVFVGIKNRKNCFFV